MSFSEHETFIWLSAISAFIALFGLIYSWISFSFLKNFQRKDTALRPALNLGQATWPRLSVFKPLHGNIPLLEAALETLIKQDYPDFEILFGVQDPKDEAIETIRALEKKYPERKIKLVISTQTHGLNGKVSNLINLQKEASSDIFVIADADIHVQNHWLKYIVSTLNQPDIGLVTAPYAGISAHPGNLWQFFSRLGINSCFLPGVLVSRHLGRQDCFGATMAIRRQKLQEIGGFKAIIDYIADDAKLACLVRDTGAQVALLPTLTHTSVTENSFSKLLMHELRWGRTTRSVQPLAYAASILQFSLVWASCALVLNPCLWTGIFFTLCLFSRWLNVIRLEKMLLPKIFRPQSFPGKFIYLFSLFFVIFLREWLGAFMIFFSFLGQKVRWAGHILSARPIGPRKRILQKVPQDFSLLSEASLASPLSLEEENRVRMGCSTWKRNFPYSHPKDPFARLADRHRKSTKPVAS